MCSRMKPVLLQIPVRVTFSKMTSLTENCDKFTLWGGSVVLGASGIVVQLNSSGRDHISHLTIEFEDESGASVDFHAWCACRPRWPLEYGPNNAKMWWFSSSDPTFCHRGLGPSSQRVNETVRYHQLRLTVSSSGQWHGLDIEVYAEQSRPGN